MVVPANDWPRSWTHDTIDLVALRTSAVVHHLLVGNLLPFAKSLYKGGKELKCVRHRRTITVDGRDWKASEWVKVELEPLCRRKTTVDGKEQWYFTKSIRIPGVTHMVRIVVLWSSYFLDTSWIACNSLSTSVAVL
jgi:hypothetical protein